VASARLSLFVDTNVGITSKRKFGFNGTTFTASEENFALIQSGNSQVFINSIQMPQNQGDGNKKDFNLDWAISGIIAASIEVPFKSEATVTLTLQDGTKPSDTKKINGADTFAVVKIKAPTPPITAECTVKSFLKRVEQRQRDFVGSNFIPGVITEGKRN
jgi:hypothetical protein